MKMGGNWKNYLGIKYKHLGRGFEEGDCLNLVLLFYQGELGINLPDFTDYDEDWAGRGKNYFLEMYRNYEFRKLRKNKEYKYGDVLLFHTRSAVAHCGVVVDPENFYFLHTMKNGTAINSFFVGEWAERLKTVLRHKSIR
jgi:cell wall-associated NlpC family hydrolase